ncbi:uncharacterized protein [Choristoneura fumiferana]|uniref:uncharacterized protein n=1 Tax=Choristoneura fumiferana TaxID=7141 RepID=UPI003D155871
MNHRSLNLLDLPEEVLINIVRRLDTKSLVYVNSSCSYLRNIVGMQGVIKEFNISLSNLATVQSFSLNFFKDIAGHLNKLDVSCVSNLNKPMLLNSMMKLKALKILNISYTSINIMDLFEIHQVCPTINDICMNFDFGVTTWVYVPTNIQEKCHDLFNKFENIHFVGNFESLYFSNLPLSLLQRAKLNKLQLTITDCNLPPYEDSEDFESLVEFVEMTVYLLNWKNKHKSHSDFNGFFLASVLEVSKCEFIIIVWLDIIYRAVYVSPLFKEFFKDKFKVHAECLIEMAPRVLGGNVVLMVWNKDSTVFDEAFFKSLFKRLQFYFPYHHESLNGTLVLPQGCDWIYITQFEGSEFGPNQEINLFNQVLDLDAMTAEKESLKLSIHLPNVHFENFITVPIDGKYLKKITYIDLSSLMCFSGDIFSTLFSCCSKLETLNMIFDDYSITALYSFTESLPLCKNVKNVRVVSPCLDLPAMLVNLSKCRNLENIHLIDKFSDPQPLSFSRALFESCVNLYNFSVAMEMTADVRARKLNILNNFKLQYGKDHINIELYSADRYSQYSYDPFVGVFNICPIKPL